MTVKKTKCQPAFCFIAVGCFLLWLLATSYCGVDHLFESALPAHGHGHGGELARTSPRANASEPKSHERADAAPSHDGDKHGRDSHHGDDQDGICCSTLHATAQTPQPGLAAAALQSAEFLCTVLNAQETLSTTPQARFDRHAEGREWVFTPEVSLGPAFRSHAPPFSSLV
jgi:hypothetical protein